jgi:hypothetical protein
MVRRWAGASSSGLVETFQRSFSHENTNTDPSGDSAGVIGTSIGVSARSTELDVSIKIDAKEKVSDFIVDIRIDFDVV